MKVFLIFSFCIVLTSAVFPSLSTMFPFLFASPTRRPMMSNRREFGRRTHDHEDLHSHKEYGKRRKFHLQLAFGPLIIPTDADDTTTTERISNAYLPIKVPSGWATGYSPPYGDKGLLNESEEEILPGGFTPKPIPWTTKKPTYRTTTTTEPYEDEEDIQAAAFTTTEPTTPRTTPSTTRAPFRTTITTTTETPNESEEEILPGGFTTTIRQEITTTDKPLFDKIKDNLQKLPKFSEFLPTGFQLPILGKGKGLKSLKGVLPKGLGGWGWSSSLLSGIRLPRESGEMNLEEIVKDAEERHARGEDLTSREFYVSQKSKKKKAKSIVASVNSGEMDQAIAASQVNELRVRSSDMAAGSGESLSDAISKKKKANINSGEVRLIPVAEARQLRIEDDSREQKNTKASPNSKKKKKTEEIDQIVAAAEERQTIVQDANGRLRMTQQNNKPNKLYNLPAITLMPPPKTPKVTPPPRKKPPAQKPDESETDIQPGGQTPQKKPPPKRKNTDITLVDQLPGIPSGFLPSEDENNIQPGGQEPQGGYGGYGGYNYPKPKPPSKEIYFFAPPKGFEPTKRYPKPIKPPLRPKKQVQVIFVKTPDPEPPIIPDIPQIPPNPEQKTLIYVVAKKPEDAPNVTIPLPGETKSPKPDVYYVRYKGTTMPPDEGEEQIDPGGQMEKGYKYPKPSKPFPLPDDSEEDIQSQGFTTTTKKPKKKPPKAYLPPDESEEDIQPGGQMPTKPPPPANTYLPAKTTTMPTTTMPAESEEDIQPGGQTEGPTTTEMPTTTMPGESEEDIQPGGQTEGPTTTEMPTTTTTEPAVTYLPPPPPTGWKPEPSHAYLPLPPVGSYLPEPPTHAYLPEPPYYGPPATEYGAPVSNFLNDHGHGHHDPYFTDDDEYDDSDEYEDEDEIQPGGYGHPEGPPPDTYGPPDHRPGGYGPGPEVPPEGYGPYQPSNQFRPPAPPGEWQNNVHDHGSGSNEYLNEWDRQLQSKPKKKKQKKPKFGPPKAWEKSGHYDGPQPHQQYLPQYDQANQYSHNEEQQKEGKGWSPNDYRKKRRRNKKPKRPKYGPENHQPYGPVNYGEDGLRPQKYGPESPESPKHPDYSDFEQPQQYDVPESPDHPHSSPNFNQQQSHDISHNFHPQEEPHNQAQAPFEETARNPYNQPNFNYKKEQKQFNPSKPPPGNHQGFNEHENTEDPFFNQQEILDVDPRNRNQGFEQFGQNQFNKNPQEFGQELHEPRQNFNHHQQPQTPSQFDEDSHAPGKFRTSKHNNFFNEENFRPQSHSQSFEPGPSDSDWIPGPPPSQYNVPSQSQPYRSHYDGTAQKSILDSAPKNPLPPLNFGNKKPYVDSSLYTVNPLVLHPPIHLEPPSHGPNLQDLEFDPVKFALEQVAHLEPPAQKDDADDVGLHFAFGLGTKFPRSGGYDPKYYRPNQPKHQPSFGGDNNEKFQHSHYDGTKGSFGPSSYEQNGPPEGYFKNSPFASHSHGGSPPSEYNSGERGQYHPPGPPPKHTQNNFASPFDFSKPEPPKGYNDNVLYPSTFWPGGGPGKFRPGRNGLKDGDSDSDPLFSSSIFDTLGLTLG